MSIIVKITTTRPSGEIEFFGKTASEWAEWKTVQSNQFINTGLLIEEKVDIISENTSVVTRTFVDRNAVLSHKTAFETFNSGNLYNAMNEYNRINNILITTNITSTE